MHGTFDQWRDVELLEIWPPDGPSPEIDRLVIEATVLQRKARAQLFARGFNALARLIRSAGDAINPGLLSLARTIRAHHCRKRTLAALLVLDDRTLHDIGLSRGNLMHVAENAGAQLTLNEHASTDRRTPIANTSLNKVPAR